MLWRRSAPAQTLPAPGPVPDAHAIRQLLLQASWKRDRWVARRRVAMRWALWAARRYVLPAALALATLTFVWLWALPRWLTPDAAPVAAPAAATIPAPVPTSAQLPAPMPYAVSESPNGRSGVPAEPILQLRLQSELLTPGTPATAISTPSTPSTKAAPSPADRFPPPTLTSDNWLHSKEP